MIKWLLCLLLLTGCATQEPSELIVETAKQEVVEVKKTIDRLEKTTPEVCKTDAFVANLEAVKSQMMTISRQLDTTTKTCTVEKDVLREKITTRDVVIISLILFVLILLIFMIRGKTCK